MSTVSPHMVDFKMTLNLEWCQHDVGTVTLDFCQLTTHFENIRSSHGMLTWPNIFVLKCEGHYKAHHPTTAAATDLDLDVKCECEGNAEGCNKIKTWNQGQAAAG